MANDQKDHFNIFFYYSKRAGRLNTHHLQDPHLPFDDMTNIQTMHAPHPT